MKLLRYATIVLAVLLISRNATSNTTSPLDTIKIKDQFNYITTKSTKYNEYRVVKITSLNQLKSNVFDSIDVLKKEISDLNVLLNQEISKNDTLNASLLTSLDELAQTKNEKDNMSLFGLFMSKQAYNTLMWTLTLSLFVAFALFVFLFNRSNSLTSRTKKDLEELKEELENNRRKAREREEKVVRKLHDEINRYKKRVYQLEKSTHN